MMYKAFHLHNLQKDGCLLTGLLRMALDCDRQPQNDNYDRFCSRAPIANKREIIHYVVIL